MGIDLAHRAGIKWTYITGRGGMQTIMDVVTGQADVFFNGMLPTVPHIHSGRLKLLAVSSDKRVASFPQVATIAESGFTGFLTGSWQGILAPAGTPQPIVRRLYDEFAKALKSPDVSGALQKMELAAPVVTPEQFAAMIASDIERVSKVIKEVGAKAD